MPIEVSITAVCRGAVVLIASTVLTPSAADAAGRKAHASAKAPAVPAVARQPALPAVRVVKPPAVPAVCANADLVPSAANLHAVDEATMCLVNQARKAAGLVALAENADLDRAALGHTEDMLDAGYFSHAAPDGSGPAQRIRATGFVPTVPDDMPTENIAAGTAGEATPAFTVAGWLADPAHRADMLGARFRETGVGVVAAVPPELGAGAEGATYTEEFA
jgi:uncharacterized protein YkwD